MHLRFTSSRSSRRLLRPAHPRNQLLVVAVFALLGSGASCPDHGRETLIPPANTADAVAQINANFDQIREPIVASGLLSMKFRNANGNMRDTGLLDAKLYYDAPRRFRLDLRQGLAGTVAQFGCNEKRYWIWTDLDEESRKLWWGEWALLTPRANAQMPVPPDQFLDALMLDPLPTNELRLSGPVLQEHESVYRLIYSRIDAAGRAQGFKEVRLSEAPPYLPKDIIERRADGTVAMLAKLSKYEPLGDGGPLTAREYVVTWPNQGSELRLSLMSARFDARVQALAFAFPSDWKYASERLDGGDPSAPLAETAGP